MPDNLMWSLMIIFGTIIVYWATDRKRWWVRLVYVLVGWLNVTVSITLIARSIAMDHPTDEWQILPLLFAGAAIPSAILCVLVYRLGTRATRRL